MTNDTAAPQDSAKCVSAGLFSFADSALVDGYYHQNPVTGVITVREGFPPRTCWPKFNKELKADVFTHRL